ncbi:MAG: preprotein translocase subunit SecA [Chitinophagales bacterium]|jgi:preprotein translocase subunit SecA|nr:preprotein translocase subunit SecA [Chitinophagales bacterium]
MAGFFTKIMQAIFGNKAEKDIKATMPRVEQINAEYAKLAHLSNDELRQKTDYFKQRIADYLQEIDQQIGDMQQYIKDNPDLDPDDKETYYKQIDEWQKERDVRLEEILNELLPEAFAVVKETARRFKENTELVATATDLDRELAVRLPSIVINDNGSVSYRNSWVAAGNTVTWDMLHYDVQLIGGIALHSGKIAEMATGEGKTLVATLPAYLNALAGQGVHIVTVNDYLARRDSEWKAPLFNFLGLRVDCIDKHRPNTPERRNAYNADITYGTNNEFGFDYLRDNMVFSPAELVQRKHHYAMVDEVDSVLIDDARTPLIISGPVDKGEQQEFEALKPRIERVVQAQSELSRKFLNEAKKLISEGKTNQFEGGLALLRAHRGMPKHKQLIKFLSETGMKKILTEAENYYMQENNKRMPEVDKELLFVIEEKNNSVDLTDKGIEFITGSSEDPNFFVIPDIGSSIVEIQKIDAGQDEKIALKDALMQDYAVKSERIHTIQQLLKAYTLFELDVEYIIDEGKIKIVDEQTGRVLDGRRYSDGLHQAIEAKENVKIEAATQTFATITLQNYFRMYHKLAGMTGTAETEAGELWEIYKLEVMVIPTNRDIVRNDMEDVVYKTAREKYNAVADEVQRLREAGRPTLVGTTSVENSEILSRLLRMRGIPHNVLNAKQHQREAEIVAQAGQSGAVTIATNMAGRGTDIKLSPEVKASGGLAIIGTERHESRRVDRQLRGRAGRQGDPGSSQFFVSLEDNLMRLFGSDRTAAVMDRMGLKDGEMIQHSMITKSIERAQKKVEENHFGTRKRLLDYDEVMNAQRKVIYGKRRHALLGQRLSVDLNHTFHELCEALASYYKEIGDYKGFELDVIRHFATESGISESTFANEKPNQLSKHLFEQVMEFYKRKTEHIASQAYPIIKEVYEQQEYERIIVPFSDGRRNLTIAVDLKDAYEQNCRPLVRELERTVSLMYIDEAWKEHLRHMDELKQSVQTAIYEQKDPLLIYKKEAFDIFGNMISDLNSDITSYLFRASLPMANPQQVNEEKQQRPKNPMRHTHTNREEHHERPPVRQNPMRVSVNNQPPPPPPVEEENVVRESVTVKRTMPKVGRNDMCPCGSGKKYKNCHGREE